MPETNGPSRASLVMKNNLLWVIGTALGTATKCCRAETLFYSSVSLEGFLKPSRLAGTILGCLPFFIHY